MNVVVIANVRGVGNDVWPICGWFKTDLLIWKNGKLGLLGEGEKSNSEPSYTISVCVVNRVCLLM